MVRRPPRSTQSRSSAASDGYKRQIVNGPGEMADAQYGYVGEGNGKVTLYKGKIPVMRGIPQEEAVQRLLELIESQQK